MNPIANIIDAPKELSRAPLSSSDLTKEQLGAVVYFFARLRTTDPVQFDTIMPDEKTESLVKREHSRYIKDFTKAQIDRGFDELHRLRQSGEKDFKWLNIDKVIGLISNPNADGNPAGIHKVFAPLALPDKTAQEKAKKVGSVELDRMKALFQTLNQAH